MTNPGTKKKEKKRRKVEIPIEIVLDATWLINIATWLQPVIAVLKVMSLNRSPFSFLSFFVKLMIRSTGLT